jgi:hypothetical protein
MSPSTSPSSQAVVLLVGGTKILERALQTAVPAPLVSVGTIEEAMRVLDEKATGLVVFGPTLRRSLAMVSTLRREGQAEPKLLVVYRDDQRDEVKRHMKGKQVADRYVIQSRIGKDLEPAAAELWGGSGHGRAQTEDLEEIPMEALEDMHESHTREMSVLELEDGDSDLPPPTPGEVLGAFDATAFESDQDDDDLMLEEMEEIEMLDDGTLEELPPATQGTVELSLADLVEELEPVELQEEVGQGDALEELDSVELVEELEVELEAGQDEMLEAADLVEEHGGEESVLDDSLLEESAPETAETPPPAPQAVAARPTSEEAVAPLLSAALVQLPEKKADLDAPTTRPSRNAVPAFAPAANKSGATAPEPPVADKRPQSGAHAMFSELSGFMDRLQEMSALTARLEADNDQLRGEITRLREQARPEIESEAREAKSRLSEVQVRLEGAEGARDAAVEARMKAEQELRAREAEIAALRNELTALQSRESALESQIEAKRRLAADAGKTLRQMAQLLEG